MREVFGDDYAHHPPLVEEAPGKQMLALLRQLDASAPLQTNSPRRWTRLSLRAWTLMCSSACLASASLASASGSVPGCSARSETTGPGSPMPAA